MVHTKSQGHLSSGSGEEDFKGFLLYMGVWKVKSDIIQCIHLCFCMLAISFYFVNCVIMSCEL